MTTWLARLWAGGLEDLGSAGPGPRPAPSPAAGCRQRHQRGGLRSAARRRCPARRRSTRRGCDLQAGAAGERRRAVRVLPVGQQHDRARPAGAQRGGRQHDAVVQRRPCPPPRACRRQPATAARSVVGGLTTRGWSANATSPTSTSARYRLAGTRRRPDFAPANPPPVAMLPLVSIASIAARRTLTALSSNGTAVAGTSCPSIRTVTDFGSMLCPAARRRRRTAR